MTVALVMYYGITQNYINSGYATTIGLLSQSY